MVAIPKTFNIDDLDLSGGSLVHIPDGTYPAICINSEIKQTSSGNGQMIVFTFAITGLQHNGAQLIERLNVVNPNETAMKIAYQTLGKIAKALNMQQTPSDTTMIHNKPLMIDVKTEQGAEWTDKNGVVREGKAKSVIADYKPAQQVGAMSQQQAPEQQALQPVAQAANTPQKSPFAL